MRHISTCTADKLLPLQYTLQSQDEYYELLFVQRHEQALNAIWLHRQNIGYCTMSRIACLLAVQPIAPWTVACLSRKPLWYQTWSPHSLQCPFALRRLPSVGQ